ncbi:UNVERIFIED_ORG: hypothetical protein J2Y77_004447 [Pseudomonas lini]
MRKFNRGEYLLKDLQLWRGSLLPLGGVAAPKIL